MDNVIFILSGMIISVLHALLPNHWLPFVLISRTEKWGYRKALLSVFIAGGLHVASTSLIGILSVFIIKAIYTSNIMHVISGVIPMLFGMYYLYKGMFSKSNSHQHKLKFKETTMALTLMLMFSPCEAVIPVFISATQKSMVMLIVLAFALFIGTTLSLITITFLALKEYDRFNLKIIEGKENTIIGIILIIIGVFAFVF